MVETGLRAQGAALITISRTVRRVLLVVVVVAVAAVVAPATPRRHVISSEIIRVPSLTSPYVNEVMTGKLPGRRRTALSLPSLLTP